MKVLSWGGGTQSTALGEMSASGEIEPLDAIIFADTGFERQSTLETVWYFSKRWSKMGAKVYIVSNGNIRLQGASDHIHIPFWTKSGAPLMRQCTRHFKITPVKRIIRQLAGYHATKPPHPPAGSIEQWIGFSLDEWQRMKSSRLKFITMRWPLIEMKLNRWDSIEYLRKKGLPIPVLSACVICPYRSTDEWAEIKSCYPDEWSAAVEFDNRHRYAAINGSTTNDGLYLLRSAVPLDKTCFESQGQPKDTQMSLFACSNSECWT